MGTRTPPGVVRHTWITLLKAQRTLEEVQRCLQADLHARTATIRSKETVLHTKDTAMRSKDATIRSLREQLDRTRDIDAQIDQREPKLLR